MKSAPTPIRIRIADRAPKISIRITLKFLLIYSSLGSSKLLSNPERLEILTGKGNGPNFTAPINNITVTLGRDVTLTCHIINLGGYKIGWVKSDTKAIQSIYNHVVTHNSRVTISVSDHTMWNLHIRGVTQDDAGEYMCQVNTDPMKSQVGFINVVVPPDIISIGSTGDVIATEGSPVNVNCIATGKPRPKIHWRREDGRPFRITEPNGYVHPPSTSFRGDRLYFPKISRTDMGVYWCIASNGVPPTVSKRILVNVHFRPVVNVPNQLLGAPLRTNVTLSCNVESAPKSINYWISPHNEIIIGNSKFIVTETEMTEYRIIMNITILDLQETDIGTYKCMVKNSFGEVESTIRVYEIEDSDRGEGWGYNERHGRNHIRTHTQSQSQSHSKTHSHHGKPRRGRRPSTRKPVDIAQTTFETVFGTDMILRVNSSCSAISVLFGVAVITPVIVLAL